MKNNLLVNWIFILIFLGGGAILTGRAYSDPSFLVLATAGFIVGGLITFYIRREWRSGVVLPLMAIGIPTLGLGMEYGDSWWGFWVACPSLGANGAAILAALGGSDKIRGRFLWAAALAFALAFVCGWLQLKYDFMSEEMWWGFFWIYCAACLAASCFVPFLWLRLFSLILTHTVYRVELFNTERIPDNGGALLMVNHVSILDALVLICCTKRRIQFMIESPFFESVILRTIFRMLGVWKVPPRGKAKEMLALRENLRNALANGELVAIFPEGRVSPNGVMQLFHGSVDELLGPVDVPIYPVWLGLLHGPLVRLDNGKLHLNGILHFPMLASVSVGVPIDRHLSNFEMRQILHEMGAEVELQRQYREMPIHYQMLRNARIAPFGRCYADAMGKGLTNLSLAIKALALSRAIRRATPKEEIVGIMLPNCLPLAVGIYALMLADKTTAIINFTAGEASRKACFEKANIKTVLTSRKFIEKLNMPPAEWMVFLEDLATKVTAADKLASVLANLFLPRRLIGLLFFPKSYKDVFRTAVVLFSSGSSGTPKGVMLSHRNLNADFYSYFRVIGCTRNDRILGNLPLFHAFGFTIGFWIPAMARALVVFVTNPLDGALIGQTVEHHKLTLLIATPTFLQTYMRRCSYDQLRSLRLVITGAEKLRRDISDKFRTLTGLAVVEGYGCTELAPIASINLAQDTLELGRKAGKPGSIGVPMPGVFIKIVDPDTGKMCQPDEDGIIQVKGGLVMQGYLNDPEATAKVLVNGFYNTGDIGSMDEKSYITITGRLSRFSKISGEMVPDEMVEMHMNEILGAEQRVLGVTGAPDAKRGERLVVIHSLTDLDVDELIDKLRSMGLPNLWIPKREDFHYVERLPLLGSGKLDLQTLKQLAIDLSPAVGQ